MYLNYIKVCLDFVIALLLIIVFSPLMLILIIVLTIANQGTPFFTQNRPGKNEKIFKIIKFKTMSDAKDLNGKLLPDEDRLTWLGKFVRKTSFDELPQLINIIIGDMSFIGPRPLLIGYLDLYKDAQKERHNVKPGMTGWAQVNGRNAISWSLKFKLDIYYIKNVSFYLDVKIFFKTISKVIMSEGVSAKNHVTIEKFNGEN